MRILLIEDSEINIEAARQQLSDHELTIVSTYSEAKSRLARGWRKVANRVLEEQVNPLLPEGWTLMAREAPRGFITKGERQTERLQDQAEDIQQLVAQIRDRLTYELNTPQFDVVLTDVMIPHGAPVGLDDAAIQLVESQGPMPYGPMIVLLAIQAGLKRVGVLTNANHHADPISNAFDNLDGFSAGDVKVFCSNWMTRWDEHDHIKQWDQLLKEVME